MNCCTAPTGVSARTFWCPAPKMYFADRKFPLPIHSCLTGSAVRVQHGEQPVKRRQAMLESNPPRNSRWQTHQDDEAGDEAGNSFPPGKKTHRIDRSAHASENSSTLCPKERWRFVIG